MSITTDAMLLYGLYLGENRDLVDMAELLGLKMEVPPGGFEEAWEEEETFCQALPKGLTLEVGGHTDCPCYFIVACDVTAKRGRPKQLDDLPDPSVKAANKLEKLGDILGQRPMWWLTPYTDF